MPRAAGHLTLLVAFLGLLAGNAAELEMGGVRQVRATVTHEASGIICKVSFIPVSCFDAAMNHVVNQQKARAYALQAMSKAQGMPDGTVSTPSLRPATTPTIEAGRLTVTYQADDIKLVREHKTASDLTSKKNSGVNPGKTNPAREMNLLACLDDIRATIQTVTVAFQEQVASLKVRDDLDDAISALESSGMGAFEKLAKEVKNQKLLLQIEKDELLPQIKCSRDEFLKNLANAYASLQKSVKS